MHRLIVKSSRRRNSPLLLLFYQEDFSMYPSFSYINGIVTFFTSFSRSFFDELLSTEMSACLSFKLIGI